MKTNNNKGFTLIELMITVAIAGILLSIAVNVYHDFMVRARVLEGISLAAPAKSAVGTASVRADDLFIIASTWNNQNGGANGSGNNSKYINSISIDDTTGAITISYNASKVGLATAQATLIYTPWINDGSTVTQLATAQATGISGVLDWACTSNTKNTASVRGMGGSSLGSVLTKFVPSECR